MLCSPLPNETDCLPAGQLYLRVAMQLFLNTITITKSALSKLSNASVQNLDSKLHNVAWGILFFASFGDQFGFRWFCDLSRP